VSASGGRAEKPELGAAKPGGRSASPERAPLSGGVRRDARV
jgi:hypothetical protein